MLEHLTKLKINKNLRINNSIEFLDDQSKDFSNLPLQLYLKKYYSKLDVYQTEVWDKVMLNLIELSYNETTYSKMIDNFGYSSIDRHDFKKQYQFYNGLKRDSRLDEDMRKFIGFMAGNHFFDKYVENIDEWFNSYHWTKPYLSTTCSTEILNYRINDVLNLPYGLNYLKAILPQLNHWRR